MTRRVGQFPLTLACALCLTACLGTASTRAVGNARAPGGAAKRVKREDAQPVGFGIGRRDRYWTASESLREPADAPHGSTSHDGGIFVSLSCSIRVPAEVSAAGWSQESRTNSTDRGDRRRCFSSACLRVRSGPRVPATVQIAHKPPVTVSVGCGGVFRSRPKTVVVTTMPLLRTLARVLRKDTHSRSVCHQPWRRYRLRLCRPFFVVTGPGAL